MNTPVTDSYPVCVAPMMDWTDRHCRYFLRLVSPRVRLYTEMVVAQAVIHGDRDRLLGFATEEHPVALQLGGSDPDLLARAAIIGEQYGYDEINLNVGCPSDRVQDGAFGACLMARPSLVADCVAAMKSAVRVPVTVKSRIGIDDQDSVAFLHRFIDTVAAGGCDRFIVHARKAVLSGLSPKQNREIPPLCYERVYALREVFPQLTIVINGGIRSTEDVVDHLRHVHGVMIGRAAYDDPWLLHRIERTLDPEVAQIDRREVVERCLPYIENQLRDGVRLISMTRHMLGLFKGLPGARAWRRHLSERACRRGAGIEVVQEALDAITCAA